MEIRLAGDNARCKGDTVITGEVGPENLRAEEFELRDGTDHA